jgi:hypothetical protein
LRFRRTHVPSRTTAIVAAALSVAALATGPSYAGPAPDSGRALASPAAPGSPQQVRLRVGDERTEVVTTDSATPAGVLQDAGVDLNAHDQLLLVRDGRTVRKQPTRQVRAGDTVKVVRIFKHVGVRRDTIENRTIVSKTSKLAPGRRKVVAPGRDGVAKVRVVRWARNGEGFDTDVTRTVVRAPAPRRVLVGDRWGTVPGTGHLNWRALAGCESGGNPRAVNPAGYYGLYQFDTGTWRGVGGSGLPSHASADEQTYRAQRLYQQRGRSPWPNCGRLL